MVLVTLGAYSTHAEISLSTNSYLSVTDKARLKGILEPGFQLQNVPSVYYAISGYKLLGETIPKTDVIIFFI